VGPRGRDTAAGLRRQVLAVMIGLKMALGGLAFVISAG
jgi:hypothetical protein